MYRRDYVDLTGGVLLVLIGGAVCIFAISSYPLGTLQRMGPGMFPAGLGALLAALGMILTLQSLGRRGNPPDIRVFTPLFVLGGVVAFALLIEPTGMIPAIIAIIFITSLADLKIRPVSLALLCLALCLLAPFVFVVCLGLQIPLLRWPF